MKKERNLLFVLSQGSYLKFIISFILCLINSDKYICSRLILNFLHSKQLTLHTVQENAMKRKTTFPNPSSKEFNHSNQNYSYEIHLSSFFVAFYKKQILLRLITTIDFKSQNIE